MPPSSESQTQAPNRSRARSLVPFVALIPIAIVPIIAHGSMLTIVAMGGTILGLLAIVMAGRRSPKGKLVQGLYVAWAVTTLVLIVSVLYALFTMRPK